MNPKNGVQQNKTESHFSDEVSESEVRQDFPVEVQDFIKS